MKQSVRLLAALLIVPILAIVVARYHLHDLEREWQSVVLEALGPEKAPFVPPAEWLCEFHPEYRVDFPEACRWADRMHLLQSGAILAIALGIGMVLLIRLAGRIVQNRRDLLWRVFGPGLRVTLAAMVVLIALHGALGLATVWYGESALLGYVHVRTLVAIGLAAAVGVISMAVSTFRFIKPGNTEAVGLVVPRDEQPTLWGFVDEIAGKLSAQPPDNIVVGLEPNFYVTEFDVHHPRGKLTGRTLFLSLPLARLLTKGELAAIVGHELGHFRGEDTAFSQRFYPIYRGTVDALESLRDDKGEVPLTLRPAAYTLGFFLDAFAKAEREISREREFVADQAGAEVAGKEAMAAALVKAHAYSTVWQPLMEQVQARLQQGEPLDNVSRRFTELVQEKAVPESLRGLDEQEVPHPVDTHPPLSQRLEALGYSLDRMREAALRVAPDDPAAALFTDPEAVEVALTEQLHSLLRPAAPAGAEQAA